MPFYSPLRYPGGKRRLVNFIKTIMQENGLLGRQYIEPYAGGASIGLALLIDGYVNHIHINDLDKAIYAFWYSVIYKTDELCELIEKTPVTMSKWHQQRKIQENPERITLLHLGLSTFFLNRTNRSGIITGGVIGGKDQRGDWKLDCRYNKTDLIKRIRKVAQYREQITLHNRDAAEFIKTILPTIEENALVYFDPPYFTKGQQLLYVNYYGPEDHKSIADLIPSLKQYWIISYDDEPEIRSLYKNYKSLSYKLHYSAQDKRQGKEILFFCDNLVIPNLENPQQAEVPRLAN